MLRLSVCFLFAVLISGLTALAQTSPKTVAGVVSDASGSVIANAEITLVAQDANEQEAARLKTRTDESGHYSFSSVPTDEIKGIRLEVAKDGKRPHSQTFTVKSNRDGVAVIDITVRER